MSQMMERIVAAALADPGGAAELAALREANKFKHIQNLPPRGLERAEAGVDVKWRSLGQFSSTGTTWHGRSTPIAERERDMLYAAVRRGGSRIRVNWPELGEHRGARKGAKQASPRWSLLGRQGLTECR
ncbi:hypothetical protein cyc_03747 [Cyclospora cayetanensis]|uniref:Uncharacterized protein n=1 Tax=Cyclospora cayetanensis TaxID=88456 RepID=A0A1D3CYR6_9EIME|nr:hypothetical protein cyc_03747 [Cyclospora cayetanensis]